MRKSLKTDFMNLGLRSVFVALSLFFASSASASVVINEVQISPTAGRFIELYNPDSADVDLTGWYIQRKTATGSSYSSLVTSTQTNGKSIKAGGYFVISHMQLGNSDIVLDNFTLTESNTLRMRDAKGVDIDSLSWGTIDDSKSYQRLSGGWATGIPTPGTPNETAAAPAPTQEQAAATVQDTNTSTTPTSTANSTFPVDPQIFADAGAPTKTISVGANATFTGRVWGLKKEPIENARMEWSFGDGTRADGTTVSHVYYYPGEYTVVLDASSGYYAASDRISVTATTPSVGLTAGGDGTRSYVKIENSGNVELDLSDWQVVVQGKSFVLPKNTIVGAHKTLTLASEVSGFNTSSSTVAALRFPNGGAVPMAGGTVPQDFKNTASLTVAPAVIATAIASKRQALSGHSQAASVLGAVSRTGTDLAPTEQESPLWMWYTGVALLGALGAIGLRFIRRDQTSSASPADEFEIIEENEEGS